MKEKILRHFHFDLTKRNVIIIILILTTIALLDSSIVKFSSYSGEELSIPFNLGIFILFFGLFITTSIILINSVRTFITNDKKEQGKKVRLFGYFNSTIAATTILSAAVILMVILQIIFLNYYDVLLLSIQTYLSHLSPLVFLSFLIFWFVKWLLFSRNLVIMCYAISLSLISVNLVISLIYLQLAFFSSSSLLDVKPYPIYSYVIMHAGFPLTESLAAMFDFLSLISFLFMWIATAVLLVQYRRKIGNVKYFTLIGIPLIYYIFPFQNYFGDLFFPLMLSSPLLFSTIYVLTFSATKQVGAFLFSLTFWTASTLVYEDRVRKSVLVASIGIAILFGFTEISPLQYTVYPPYGLVSEAFIPVGAYLLSVGIFASAKQISEDVNIRKDFYRSAASQLALLKTIGVSQMEKELEGRVKYLERHTTSSKTKQYEGENLDEEHVKEILRDVLNELYYSKGKTKNS
jgi:hypothetical protein